MIIKQPDDKSIDKERINGMLILLNHIITNTSTINGWTDFLEDLNKMEGLKGKFVCDQRDSVVFEAGNF